MICDLQVNGFLGVDFTSPELTADSFREACHALLQRGTTVFLPTSITAPEALYERNLALMSAVLEQDDELARHVPGFHLEGPFTVRLLFEPKLAVYITERQWHPSQEFRTRPDGRVEMRLETTGRKELVRWVLSWMPDVKVLAPKSLRDRIAEKLRDGLRAQQEGY